MPVKQARPMQTYSADAYALSSQPAEDLAHGEPRLSYDYSQVAEEHRATVIASAKTIKRHERRTIENMVTIGCELKAVQDRLPHGQFLPWIEQEFGWQKTIAYNLLNLAAKFPPGGNLPVGIGLAALYQLTAAPDSALQEAQNRQHAGETITKAKATEIAARHRTAEKSGETPPPHNLTGAEAIAVVWRGIKQHQRSLSQDVKEQNEERLQWLQNAPLQLFINMLPPAVVYTETMLKTAVAAVQTELLGNIDHLARIAARAHQSQPKGALASAHVTPPSAHTTRQVDLLSPGIERLPAYLTAAGCNLTRLLDGALAAQHQDQQRIFAGNQTQDAITWLDTLVRSATNDQNRRQRRVVNLLDKTLIDLHEAHTLIIAGHHPGLTTHAPTLTDAIGLIAKVIAQINADGSFATELPFHTTQQEEKRRTFEEA
ncbi:MAG: DUF3102 domain-containing protein [Caldilinea sp. CFX5]|nr:DUF3102 domain-containing protein [Caldilinea sp. CFX5]